MAPSRQLLLVRKRKRMQLQLLVTVVTIINVVTLMILMLSIMGIVIHETRTLRYTNRERKRRRLANLNRLIRDSDVACKRELCMDRRTFDILCEMVRDIGGLTGTKFMSLEEIVAMFLYTLAHKHKNRTIGSYFLRSGESVSRNFNRCLQAVLKLHMHLLKKPTPITEDCEDSRWKCFKNCIGALDGTYIQVRVPKEDRPRYRTKKGTLAMNVLGACNPNMEFIYVLPGWEGSAHDDHVLRDAISRPHGLKVPQGAYYLVDVGYTNCEGFLAPYRGHRYHLKEWGDGQPISAEEYFNMKHSKARNVIERCFGLLKGRWGILRCPSFFPIRTQGRIVLACVLLHNLLRKYMPTDDMVVEDEEGDEDDDDDSDSDDEVEYITHIEISDAWTTFRSSLAQTLFNNWRRARLNRKP